MRHNLASSKSSMYKDTRSNGCASSGVRNRVNVCKTVESVAELVERVFLCNYTVSMYVTPNIKTKINP